eukprot:GHRR01017829.1.p1 GENE.GHRR01017829.1~~GHRR01017829.1.p1  ORF type:complete len:200 (+),score=42.31 GHRR01017829.1:402-1001(+)
MIRFHSSKARNGSFKRAFELPVTNVPDYEAVVPKERWMWLRRIKDRVQRCYYGSCAEFLADVQAIADNAVAYNTPGRGRLATPPLIDVANKVVDEGRKLLREQGMVDYWEGRAQIERGRQQGPEAFRVMLANAIRQANSAGKEPMGWHWVGCELCGKWRLVSGAAFYELGLEREDSKFMCSQNIDRPGGRCEEPPEWIE